MAKLSKKALFVKRSNAAKKGWETRRLSASKARPKAAKKRVNRGKQGSQSQSRKSENPRKGGAATTGKSRPRKDSRGKPTRVKATRPSKSNTSHGIRKPRSRAALQREIERLKQAQERDRASIRKANQKAIRAIETTEKTIANMARNGVAIKTILKQVPEEGKEHAKKIIIQTRLDMSAELFEDVRFEAFDLADELDWDISDVFDAWDYDAAAVA